MAEKKYKIGICGIGMVGGALKRYFEKKENYQLFLYDNKGVGSLNELNKADFIYICLPTPYKDGVGCDTSIIEEVIRQIEGEKVIIIKSTVIPGITDALQKKYPQHKFLCNPEFLTEVTADQDMNYPDRQIVGYTEKSYTVAKDILQQLPLAPFERILLAKEAEMVKYFGNTWFSTKVIFANQMYALCEKLGIDYERVMDAAAADKRIGRTHLKVWYKGYRGYGGKCLPKDIKALIHFADGQGVDLKLHKIVEEINNQLMRDQGIEDSEKFSKRE